MFISHDRYFINRIATEVTHVHHGRLMRYLGGYDDYLDALERAAGNPDGAVDQVASPPAVHEGGSSVRRRDAREGEPSTRGPASAMRHASGTAATPGALRVTAAAGVARAPGAASGEPPKPVARIVRRKTTAELRELRRRVEEIESRIEGLERRIEEIGRSLSDPRLYANGDRVRAITLERNEAVQQLSGLMREWEQLSTSLAGDA